MNNEGYYGEGEVELFGIDREGQVGQNVGGSAEMDNGMVHADGGYYIGQHGIDVHGDVYGLHSEATATVGGEDFNVHGGVEASLGSADATFTVTPEQVAVGAHAGVATAEVSPGFEIFGVDFTLDLSYGLQVGAEVDYSAEEGYFSADGSALGGVGFTIDW